MKPPDLQRNDLPVFFTAAIHSWMYRKEAEFGCLQRPVGNRTLSEYVSTHYISSGMEVGEGGGGDRPADQSQVNALWGI